MTKEAKLELLKARYTTLKEKSINAKSGGVLRKIARKMRNLKNM